MCAEELRGDLCLQAKRRRGLTEKSDVLAQGQCSAHHNPELLRPYRIPGKERRQEPTWLLAVISLEDGSTRSLSGSHPGPLTYPGMVTVLNCSQEQLTCGPSTSKGRLRSTSETLKLHQTTLPSMPRGRRGGGARA